MNFDPITNRLVAALSPVEIGQVAWWPDGNAQTLVTTPSGHKYLKTGVAIPYDSTYSGVLGYGLEMYNKVILPLRNYKVLYKGVYEWWTRTALGEYYRQDSNGNLQLMAKEPFVANEYKTSATNSTHPMTVMYDGTKVKFVKVYQTLVQGSSTIPYKYQVVIAWSYDGFDWSFFVYYDAESAAALSLFTVPIFEEGSMPGNATSFLVSYSATNTTQAINVLDFEFKKIGQILPSQLSNVIGTFKSVLPGPDGYLYSFIEQTTGTSITYFFSTINYTTIDVSTKMNAQCAAVSETRWVGSPSPTSTNVTWTGRDVGSPPVATSWVNLTTAAAGLYTGDAGAAPSMTYDGTYFWGGLSSSSAANQVAVSYSVDGKTFTAIANTTNTTFSTQSGPISYRNIGAYSGGNSISNTARIKCTNGLIETPGPSGQQTAFAQASAAGVTFTSSHSATSGTNRGFMSNIVYFNAKYWQVVYGTGPAATTYNHLFSSTDLLEWKYESRVASTSNLLEVFKVVNGVLFFGMGTKLWYTNDGTTITELTTGLTSVYDVEYFNSKYIVAGTSATVNLAYTADLTTAWTTLTIGTNGTSVYRLAKSGTRLVGTTSNTAKAYYSDTGTAGWTSTAFTTFALFNVMHDGTRFVATGLSTLNCASSTDGATFSSESSAGLVVTLTTGNANPAYLAYINGIYYQATSGNGVYSSTDRVTWKGVPVATIDLGKDESAVASGGNTVDNFRLTSVFAANSRLFLTAPSGQSYANTILDVASVNSGTPNMIGTPKQATLPGLVGYVRIV